MTRAEQAWCPWWPLSLLAYLSQKPRIWGLEGWLSESGHFPGTPVGGSQPPVTPAPGGSDVLFWILWASSFTLTSSHL